MEVLVLAKEPVPGLVKTRLTPPCTPEEAARLAEAALADTLEAAVASGADRVVLGLEGHPGPWCPASVEVVPQGAGGLSDRLARLWGAAHGPAVQIGMDTPQVSPAVLREAVGLVEGGAGAALGLAADGGWWALALPGPVPGCFEGVAPSRADTGAQQLLRLAELGRRPVLLPVLADVDRWPDAVAVAAGAPRSRFGAAQRRVAARVGLASIGRAPSAPVGRAG